MTARRWLLAMLVCAACSSESTPRKLEPQAKPVERSARAPARDEAAVAASRELVAGPAVDATLEQRKAAVLELLTDGTSAEHLPLAITDER